MSSLAKDITQDSMADYPDDKQRVRRRNTWACSPCTIFITLLGLGALGLMVQSFLTRQMDTKGCVMSYMRPSYLKLDDFDTEHTRFANKYALYLYREGGIDEDSRVRTCFVLVSLG